MTHCAKALPMKDGKSVEEIELLTLPAIRFGTLVRRVAVGAFVLYVRPPSLRIVRGFCLRRGLAELRHGCEPTRARGISEISVAIHAHCCMCSCARDIQPGAGSAQI